MELRHLRYFKALAECLSFTRAAERVHVTQSTLSHQIRQLEEEIGQPLFDRVGKRVILTEAGELFLAYAARALKEIDQGLGVLKQGTTALSGEIRVGAAYVFNLGFLPTCMANFLQRHPTVKILVEELTSDTIIAKLEEGQLDLGIAYRPGHESSLWFEPLYNEEMVLVVSDQHPLAQRKRIRMVELHRQSLVLHPESFATRLMLNEYFQACGAEPVVSIEMNTVAGTLALVSMTTIGTILSSSAVPPDSPLKVIPIESPTPMRTPGILWHRDIDRSAVVRAFAGIIRKTALTRSLRSTWGADRSSSLKR